MVAPAVRGEIIWDSDGTLWAMNVVHFDPTPAGVIDQSTADGLANILGPAFTAVFPPNTTSLSFSVSNTNRLHSVRVSDLRIENPTTFSTNILIAGDSTADQLPDNVSLPVELVVGSGARNGRVFQWGLGEGANAPTGRPAGGTIDATVSFWEQLMLTADTIPGVASLGVLRRTTLTQPLPPSVAEVIAVRRSPTMIAAGWSQQKRRRDGLQLIV